jgi:DNA polymerase III epsilon subunit family exonuclease
MNILILDTETTGLEKEDKVIQIGYIAHHSGKEFANSEIFSEEKETGYKAMAVHNITPEMQAGKRKFEDWAKESKFQEIIESSILVAHNAQFDIGMIEKSGLKVGRYICTKKVAAVLYPEMDSHSLQYLRYALGLYKDEKHSGAAHDALNDCYYCKDLLKHMVAEGKKRGWINNIEIFIDYSCQPLLMHKIRFGKHAKIGENKTFEWIARNDMGYLTWMNKNEELMKDEDLAHTVKHWIRRISIEKNTQ